MGTETVAQRFAASLQQQRRYGVRHVFGQRTPPPIVACLEKRIRQVTYRTENAGGAMADGYARKAWPPFTAWGGDPVLASLSKDAVAR